MKDRQNKSDLFNILSGILDNNHFKCLPVLLSNRFNMYFLSKVEKIRISIPCFSLIVSYDSVQTQCVPFNSFRSISSEDLELILKEMGKINTSPIDPLPAKLLTKCIDTLLPVLVEIINKSLREGTVEGLKHSVIN